MKSILEKREVVENFQNLIYPYTLEDFSENYWGKKPLIIKREDKSYFKSLLSVADVDEVLDFHRPKGNSIRVVKNQEPLDKTKYENEDGSLNLNQIYASYADGYTIVVNEIDRLWKPLKNLCHNTKGVLNHKTVANMYLTPKNQKALLPHYDTHDVFVVQVEGKKHWKLYDAEYTTPIVNSFQPIFQREQLKNVKDIILNAGDMMYIPRGIPHEAVTTDESSLHLTIGVFPTQWLDFLTKSLHYMAQTNIELRQALPIGFMDSNKISLTEDIKNKLQNLLNTVLQENNTEGANMYLAEESRIAQKPISDGHFESLDEMNELELNSYLVKRENMNCKVQQMGTISRIIFSGNIIRGPIHISPALDFIAARESTFQVGEIPILNEMNKLKLAKRLIRGGLLKLGE